MEKQIHRQSKSYLPLFNSKSFIETQFPVAKISMESYKERTAKQGQTLTGLGKWWGRKPLVLVRAALLGLLMPASDDPKRDEEIFLKIITMDSEGLWLRKSKNIPGKRLITELMTMSPGVQKKYLEFDSRKVPKLRKLDSTERIDLQKLIFERFSYVEKLKYCDRPEQVEGPSRSAWDEINKHFDTNAYSINELVNQLGVRRFGKRPRVGDAFCGGGSIPFEAARLGCNVFGSDLNPVATLLTWASINLIGGGEEVGKNVQQAQKKIYELVDRQIIDWNIEHNSLGWRADYYLYCVEVVDPESGWKIPLLPKMVIGKKNNVIAKLVPDEINKRYDIEIVENVSDEEMKEADKQGTIIDSRLVPPNSETSTPIDVIRKNLRLWENQDLIPRGDDVFQERLYCIRWVEAITDENGKKRTSQHYRAPNIEDIAREEKVYQILREKLFAWQENGYLPNHKIDEGSKTSEPTKTRGWTYWHQLFTPRQLLYIGSLLEAMDRGKYDLYQKIGILLGAGRVADYNSRLSRWNPRTIGDKAEQTFSNQALNPLYNFPVKSFSGLVQTFLLKYPIHSIPVEVSIIPDDARTIKFENDIWITDPPYADAISYEEITEFFLYWYEGKLKILFPDWYSDTKRVLAVKGSGLNFRKSMIDCYQNIRNLTPENGLFLVMFTHQDATVWADLSMILWAAGLRVTAAWTISTETVVGLKTGNYVQGTVLLVLRKRVETEPVFLDELNHRIEAEVRNQLDSMLAFEDNSDPNFGDADYQLAAYAAALRVLTERPIFEIDPERDVLRERTNGEISPVEQMIRNAVRIACDHLVPKGFDRDLWKELTPIERFYLKGIEVESHGEYRNGVYQELARGFGAVDYTEMLSSTKANETRLKKPSEFGRRNISGEGFAGSLVRTCLFAVYRVDKDNEVNLGLNWFHTELVDYWTMREKIVKILEYLALIGNIKGMEHWKEEAHTASLLAGAVRNDHV